MNGFKYKRIQNKFRWESDFMVLEFSRPSIEGFNSFTYLKDESDIMYYYYTVKLFKKVNQSGNKAWKLVSKRDIYDFPTITQLKYILHYQLNDKDILNGQKIEYESGKIIYSKTMETQGFACEDFYQITKKASLEGKDEQYIVYCGTSYDIDGDLNSVGIRTPYVYREDIKQLLECVSSFVQYSLDKHNKDIEDYYESFNVMNEKIYKYDIDEHGVNKNKLESIFAVGDKVDITYVIDNKEYGYDDIVITKIDSKNIELNDGNRINNNSIACMYNRPTDKMLKYKEDDIAQDFLNILSEEEIKEFKCNDIDELLDKYKMAIINRTHMCREEHEFNKNYKTGDAISCITPIVRNIIDKIKNIYLK